MVQNLLRKKGDRAAFSNSEQLVARGRLQSIDSLEVLVFLENKYGIDFVEIGFDQNQVESIDNVTALIEGKWNLKPRDWPKPVLRPSSPQEVTGHMLPQCRNGIVRPELQAG